MAKRLGKVGIVAGGGGYKVFFAVGVMKYLTQEGVVPSLVSAVSGTALILAEYIGSNCKTEGLELIARVIEARGRDFLFNRTPAPFRFFKDNALFASDGLRALIWGHKSGTKEILRGIDVAAVLASPVEFFFTTRNETSGFASEIVSSHDLRFKNDLELYRQFLQGSCSICSIFPPVKIAGSWYSDGLYPNLELAFEAGCDTIFVVLNDGPPIKHPELLSCADRIPFSFYTAHDDLLEKEIERLVLIRRDFTLVDEGQSRLPFWRRCLKFGASVAASITREEPLNFIPHRLIMISPRQCGKLTTIGFEKGDLLRAIDHGFECAKDILENL